VSNGIGGVGVSSAITGTGTFRAGGGGGSGGSPAAGSGGTGGGGAGNVAGTSNTGGGGGRGAAGGSGVVIIRQLRTESIPTTLTGGAMTVSGLYAIYTFNSSGTIAWTA